METGIEVPATVAPRMDRAADFAALFEACHARLLRYLDTLLRDPGLAEDVAQDAFLKAYQALERGAVPENPNAWLYAIATNTALSALRRRRLLAWLPLARSGGAESMALPGDLAERSAEKELLLNALARLSKPDAACLLLRFQQGLTFEELAVALRLSVPAAKMRLCRARAAFRTIYLSLRSEADR